jgi:hypothetical protein
LAMKGVGELGNIGNAGRRRQCRLPRDRKARATLSDPYRGPALARVRRLREPLPRAP